MAGAAGDLAKAQKAADQAEQAADVLEQMAPGSPEALLARQNADEAIEAVQEKASPGTLIGNLNDINPVERSMVEELLGQGKTVEIVPRVPSKTPDFRINGVSTELKTLTSAGPNTLKNAIQKAAQQGEQILIDARNVPITAENARLQILRAQGNIGSLEGRVTVLTTEGIVTF
ncbi:hypothetical protein [Leptolyngbya sp. 7M]|uniref:CdiA C-terminal domain-containing protein n=1 Tax=Leptolyngbya sp. 7M TaxID=2812896 RepID=UPI001B8D562B|nr:hypothetical protein [Leptolyngbya sp. 7M]QYO64539.1 hypothetical protein JVX88_33585 [Leptolyngbya sp. 7M]